MRRGHLFGVLQLQILHLLFFPFLTQQTVPAQVDSSPGEVLANKLSNWIADSGMKRVVIFDLTGPEGQLIPFGTWLADEISKSLVGRNKQVQVIDRAQLAIELEKQHLTATAVANRSVRIQISKSLSVDGFVVGSFGPFKDQIGLTFALWQLNSPSTTDFRYSSMLTGKLPLSIEASAHLAIPLQSLRPSDGIFQAGYAGRTIAECDFCPPPKFSPATVWRVKQGTVVAMIVVSGEGRVSEIKILESPDVELNEEAIKAIQNYRYKPAVDPDGEAVAVRMPFSVMFRIKN